MIDRVAALLDNGEGLWLADSPGVAPRGCAVVQTSGSSGRPKLVTLPREALLAAAAAAEVRLGVATWHLALPGRYVAGLMVQVRGLVGGGLRAASDLTGLELAAGANAISLVPTQLHRALQQPEARARLAACTAVLVGGGPLPAETRSRAEDARIPLIETYGMSETCGGVVWDGVALPGVEVRLREDGRITLAGPMTFAGYHGDEELTAATLIDGAVLTHDRGRIVGDRLVVDGRIDDVVISGGVNVDVAAVRAAVAALDAETAVFAVPDVEWGARIVLFATGGALREWRDRLRERLPAAALPRQLVHVDHIPRSAGGKPERESLLQLVQP